MGKLVAATCTEVQGNEITNLNISYMHIMQFFYSCCKKQNLYVRTIVKQALINLLYFFVRNWDAFSHLTCYIYFQAKFFVNLL